MRTTLGTGLRKAGHVSFVCHSYPSYQARPRLVWAHMTCRPTRAMEDAVEGSPDSVPNRTQRQESSSRDSCPGAHGISITQQKEEPDEGRSGRIRRFVEENIVLHRRRSKQRGPQSRSSYPRGRPSRRRRPCITPRRSVGARPVLRLGRGRRRPARHVRAAAFGADRRVNGDALRNDTLTILTGTGLLMDHMLLFVCADRGRSLFRTQLVGVWNETVGSEERSLYFRLAGLAFVGAVDPACGASAGRSAAPPAGDPGTGFDRGGHPLLPPCRGSDLHGSSRRIHTNSAPGEIRRKSGDFQL